MELANLQFSVESRQVDEAGRSLDQLAQKADRAQKATDGLSGGSKRLSGATAQLLASIERTVRELVEIQRAQHEFTRGMAEGAAAAIREAQAVNTATAAITANAAAVDRASTAHIQFSQSFRMVQQGASAALPAIAAADDAVRRYSMGTQQLDAHVQAFHARQAQLPAVMAKGAASAKLQAHEVANLGRQFADVGVMAAMGMSPLMVLISQGPQIADVFYTAGQRGIGFGGVMRQIGGMVAPFAPALLAIGAAAGVAFGGAALAARAVNKDVGDLSKGLGLTEAQMKRLKEEGVNTGVTIGDVFRGTFTYIAGAVGKTLEPVAKWFSKLFDDMTRWAVAGVKGIVGALVGGFYAIRAIWKQLPAVMGDLAVSAANAVINAVERMINRAIDGYNKVLPIIKALMLATGNVGGALGLREGKHVNWGDIQNRNAGAASAARDVGAAAYKEGQEAGEGWVDGVGKGLKDAWLKAAEDRIKAAAGDAGAGRKARERAGPKGPSAGDMAEQFAQRRADIERQIEQAKMEELQAQLAITHGIRERADIEREISRQQAAVKAAQLQSQLERIKADDKLTDAAKQELAAMLLGVAIRQGNAERARQRAITEQENEAQRAQEQAILQRTLDADIYILQSRLDAAQGYFERQQIEDQIFAKEVEKRRATIKHLTAEAEATKDAAKAAEAVNLERELQADVIAEMRRREQRVLDTYEALSRGLNDVVAAVRAHDWVALFKSLAATIDDLKAAWNAKTDDGKTDWGSRVGAVSSVANMAGQAIGGKAGAAISGAASGAMGAFALGSALKIGALAGPWGMAAGAVIGGLMSLFGSGKADKERKRQEEAQRQAERARRAEEVARQARELEVALAEATNDVLGKLNAERAAFLEGVAEENRALAERTYALAQAKAAQESYDALFLTEQERLVNVAAQVGDGFKSLGLNAVTSMEEFKQLADSIDRTTAAGQQLFAGLMALGPAFAQVAGFIGSLQGPAAALTPYQAAQGRVAAAQQAVAQAEANLQKAIAAETAANNAAAQAAQRVAQQFRSLAESLSKYRQTLTSGDAARLSPEEAYKQAKAAFDAIQGKTDAESLGKLQEASEDYRRASEAYYGTSLGYFADLERIKAAVQAGEKFADKTATAAEQQVAALEAANAALNGIGESVMGVAEAQKMLALAQEELRLAEEELKREELNLLQQIRDALTNGGGTPGAANDNVWTASGYLAKNADVKAHWDQGIPQKHGFTNEHEWAWSHWTGIGQSEGRKFATGGMFSGGLVNGPTAFPMGLMGEAGPEAIMPLANVGGQLGVRAAGNDNGEIVAELRELRKEVAELRSERARDTKADQAQRAAIYEGTAGLLDGSNERLDTIKRRLAR